ncbi:MAG: type II secretion system F family protein [Candidatus Omnitrophica bacterium]|nr:type II secretion system F family protein [Candidatus Omnitrophota bacterium]
MTLFQYKAANAHGQKTRGSLNAADSVSAAALLREEGLFILKLAEQKTAQEEGRWLIQFKHLRLLFLPVTKNDVIFFLRQLALMRRTGLTLLQSLEVCRNQSSKPHLAQIIEKTMQAVESGSSLSSALAWHKKYIPEIAIKMIMTAEVTGELSEILDQIAVQMERTENLKNTILTSLMYPALVVLIMIGVVTFLVTTVVPKFSSFLAQKDIALPASTQLLMDICDFLTKNKLKITIGLGTGFAAVSLGYLLPRVRLVMDRIQLSIPVLGGILSTAFIAYFTRTMAILLRSGVSLLESIHILSVSLPNRAISRHLAFVENEILKGQSFSKALRANIIPPLVTEIVNIGEVTGSLDQVLEEIGSFYEQNLQRQIKWMTTLFEPTVILMVGGVVGFVYFAFFQVLFQLTRM